MMFRWTIKQPGIQKFLNLCGLYQDIYNWISPLNTRSGRPFILTLQSGFRAINLSTIYSFEFGGIVGGYGLRHMCSHCLLASCNFFYGASGATRVNPYRDCAEIVQKSCNVSAVPEQSPHGNRTEPVRGLCNATYDRSTGYRLTIFFKFVKLLAKPNRTGRESVRKSHSCLLPPQGDLAEAARKGGYGPRRPIASQMWTRH